jgi:hypothetical protein
LFTDAAFFAAALAGAAFLTAPLAGAAFLTAALTGAFFGADLADAVVAVVAVVEFVAGRLAGRVVAFFAAARAGVAAARVAFATVLRVGALLASAATRFVPPIARLAVARAAPEPPVASLVSALTAAGGAAETAVPGAAAAPAEVAREADVTLVTAPLSRPTRRRSRPPRVECSRAILDLPHRRQAATDRRSWGLRRIGLRAICGNLPRRSQNLLKPSLRKATLTPA